MSNNLEALEAEISDLEKSITSENEQEAANTETEEVSQSDKQPAESASLDSTEETTDDEDQWLVPGKFRTADDLRQSYENLQSMATRQSQELSELKRRITQETTNSEPEVREKRLRQFADAVKEDPIGAIKNLVREELSGEALKYQEREFVNLYHQKMQNKEFAALEPDMIQIAQNMNGLVTNPKDPRILDALFLIAKAQKQDVLLNQERKKAEATAEMKQKSKRKVSVEGGSASKGQNTIDPYNIPLEELEAEINRGNL